MTKKDIPRQELSKMRAADFIGTNPDLFTNPLTVLASPAWRGVEGDVWVASANDQSIVLKHYHQDTNFYVDPQSAIAAAKEAGRLAVGPSVKASWIEDGIIAMEELGTPWVAGGLHHAVDEKIRNNVVSQKKEFQQGASLDNCVSIFDEVSCLYDITCKEKIPSHNDIIPFMEFAREAEQKITACGWDAKPCHRDGNTANLMVHPDKSVRLVDFDLAANCDPFEDVGAHLVEYFENDVDARSGFEEWYGTFDEGLFQRSMIYGLLDDLRWGLIGSIMGTRSSRTNLEFTKYAAWRFLRLEAQAKRSDAYDRIRLAA